MMESRLKYYDKQGRPITLEEFAELLEGPVDYKIIKQHIVNGFLVSTVWLGLDHSFPWTPKAERTPLIFETMIFKTEFLQDGQQSIDWAEEYQERYSTMEEALIGHERAVQLVKSGGPK